jgi:hypothetical protein
MHLIQNPFSPGAGTRPVSLAGRDDVIVKVDVSIQRIMAGLPEKSLMMVGLRGVGKTVLLNVLQENAKTHGIICLKIEAPEKQSLPSMLVPPLRTALLELSRRARSKALADKALRTLGSFIKAMKLKYRDIEISLDLGHEPGQADSGDLAHDLGQLLITAGQAARDAQSGLAMFIDELQYVQEADLAALITALHACTQAQLPVCLVGAGLPQLVGNMGKAKTYAERLFDFPELGRLDAEAARQALTGAAAKHNAHFTDAALERIYARTQGYPYFLQEWGKHSWNLADTSPIQLHDVERADALAIAELDASFFRVRFDRCTPTERQYLRAMAEFGDTARSGDVAAKLGKQPNQVAPTRNNLIKKGMIYSPAHGDTSYTVPLFAGYMQRVMRF